MAVTPAPKALEPTSDAVLTARAEVQAQKRRYRELLQEHRQAAAALRRQEEAAARLRQLDSVRRAFLLAVAHDLRGPVTALTGLARILAADAGRATPERVAALVQAMGGSASRIEFVQANLVDLERIALRPAVVARRATALGTLVEAAVAGADLRDHQVLVEATGSAAIDPIIAARILDNLLNNAAAYAPAGSWIEVRARPEPDGALLTVADHGPGVFLEWRATVFDAFVTGRSRADGSPPAQSGMGIGLHIVATFAAAHGGRAWIDETDGGGATVNVLLAERG